MAIALFVAYSTSSVIGSPDRMWELLKEAAVLHPVAGNAAGEYLTMKSESKHETRHGRLSMDG
jgi:Na+/proline symporter